MMTSLEAWTSASSVMAGSDEPYGRPDDLDPFWYEGGFAYPAGQSVTSDAGALRVSAFLSCVKVIAESVAGLPCVLFQRNDDGTRKKANQHGQYRTLHETPDELMSAFEFWELVTTKMILRGNLTGQSLLGPRGPNTVIKWIDPDRHTREPAITAMSDGSWRFYYRDDEGGEDYLSTDRNDFFHVKGMTLDGMWGMSPLSMLRLILESADKSRRWGTQFFNNGMAPSGVYESDQALSDKAYARLKAQNRERSGLARAHEALLLEEGMKFKAIAMSHTDAQFLELRKFDKTEIAGVMRVPPHMIGDLERATFANIEHQSLNFVIHCLRPWLRRIEDAIKLRLIIQPRRFYAEFNVDALLRGDTKSRYEAYGQAITNLWLAPDEVRELENRNPREDGGGMKYQNPHINPDKLKKPTPDSQASDKVQAAQPFRRQIGIFAADIANRVTSAAHREVKDRVKHAGDKDRFDAWLQDYGVAQAKFTDKAISPFCEAYDVQQAHKTECVTRIVTAWVDRVKADPVGGLAWLEESGSVMFEGFVKELVT